MGMAEVQKQDGRRIAKDDGALWRQWIVFAVHTHTCHQNGRSSSHLFCQRLEKYLV